jgi:hypothetical protein
MIEADRKVAEDILREVLVGNQIRALEIPVSEVWDFQFSGAHLNVECPWRVVSAEGILLGSCDHEHKFGLPQPLDAVAAAIELLGLKRVENLSLATKTADLEIAFEGNMFLNIFNRSSGWEGWNLTSGSGTQIIALGGGDIAIFAGKK